MLRVFPEQKWHPARLGQPLYAIIFAILFEWGVAIQDLRLGRWLTGRVTNKQMFQISRPALLKMRRQLVKDYLIWPLLGWPWFPGGAGRQCRGQRDPQPVDLHRHLLRPLHDRCADLPRRTC